jgi:hypothetical protein
LLNVMTGPIIADQMPLAIAIAAILTVSQILAAMSANTAGLTSYEVPVHVTGHVKNGAFSLPFSMDGTRYFKAPDKDALVMRTVPAIAKTFQNVYASLGTPATWPGTYEIVLVSTPVENGRGVYVLRGAYKKQSTVDHILLDVDAGSFDPITVRWFYRNGATIVMAIEESAVGTYRLPMTERLEIAFPSYRGSAVVSYGSYAINRDIPPTVLGPTF